MYDVIWGGVRGGGVSMNGWSSKCSYGVIFYYLPFTDNRAIWQFSAAYPPKQSITNYCPPDIAILC